MKSRKGKQAKWINQLPPQQIANLKQVFDLFDQDHGGTIDASEINKVMEELGLKGRNKTVFSIVQSLRKQDRSLNFVDFVQLVAGKVGVLTKKQGISKIFDLFDEDETGLITFDNLKKMSHYLGQYMNDDQILEMMHSVYILDKTPSHDGFNFDQFYEIVSKKVQ